MAVFIKKVDVSNEWVINPLGRQEVSNYSFNPTEGDLAINTSLYKGSPRVIFGVKLRIKKL